MPSVPGIGDLPPHPSGGTLRITGCGGPCSYTLRWHGAPSVAVSPDGMRQVAGTPPNTKFNRESSQTGASAWSREVGHGRESSPGGGQVGQGCLCRAAWSQKRSE